MSILREIQDGIEFFTVIATGEGKMSETGLARLSGITQQSMNDRVQHTITGNNVPELLQDFAGRDFRSQVTLVFDGVTMNLNLLPSDFCAATIEYYGFESREKRALAQKSFRKFARRGIDSWIQEITGWTPAMANQQTASEPTFESVEKFINDRLDKGLIATAVHPELVIEMLQDCGFSAAAYRLYFYLEMRALQNQHPEVETICQELNICKCLFSWPN
jgi:hypothetical protein